MNTQLKRMSALSLLTLGLFVGYSAQASQVLLMCGTLDQAGNTEVDNLNVYRGGNYENQLVVRNVNIIQDFLQKGAIYPSEINAKGEFIVEGLGSPNPASVQSSGDHRYFTFAKTDAGYELKVQRVADNGVNLTGTIASFTFGDCNRP